MLLVFFFFLLISFFRNPVATFQQPALSIRGSGPQLGWDAEICSLLAWVQGPIRYAADRTGTPCVLFVVFDCGGWPLQIPVATG